MIDYIKGGERISLNTPVKLPNASSFLWNKQMMIHMNCRGYAVSQFMQPEPAKYSYAPNLEAKTFMQPEQPYYAHHPGRFCYVKDEETQELFSGPYEPVRSKLDSFNFSAGKSDIKWIVKKSDIILEMTLHLAVDDPIEIWNIKVINNSSKKRKISIYPYFTVGYMSWMNQSGKFNEALNGIVCSSISPYQKYTDYDKVKEYKDKTFLLSNKKPDAYEVSQFAFEGDGGLHNPSAIQNDYLSKGDAVYETPVAVMQYNLALDPKENESFDFLFGPANNEKEIEEIKNKYFNHENDSIKLNSKEYQNYINKGEGYLKIETPDSDFDAFVNNWLPRQMYYHGETNRLCTDPQTRNFLQDNMGMSYINPSITKNAFITALSQQESTGSMPDGILIHKDAELKYINQVPHTDHCVWLPICLKAYLDETNDYPFLDEILPFKDKGEASVQDHINKAMLWLIENRDERGLNYINQGDWCDPMNMVGYKGKGVSGWLTMASSYALSVWSDILKTKKDDNTLDFFKDKSNEMNTSINKYLWDGNWYGRGITDDNVVFGTTNDAEGKIFLNAQGWAFLSDCTDQNKKSKVLSSVERFLETPYGVELMYPSFTKMREDIGRVTQKFPGSAENGSVYNHAGAFYIFSLYNINESDKAFELLRKMIPGPNKDDYIQRGQMPVFIPNYYRGAFKQFPRTAGKSSQLFNTGTVHWVYRSLIEGLFGVKGTENGLEINPQLPSFWNEVSIVRKFRGAIFNISIKRSKKVSEINISVDDKVIKGQIVSNFKPDKNYQVNVLIP